MAEAEVISLISEIRGLVQSGVHTNEAALDSALARLHRVPMTRALLQSTQVGRFLNTEFKTRLSSKDPLRHAVDRMIARWREAAASTATPMTSASCNSAPPLVATATHAVALSLVVDVSSFDEDEASARDQTVVPSLFSLCTAAIRAHPFRVGRIPPLPALGGTVHAVAQACATADELLAWQALVDADLFASVLDSGWKRIVQMRPDMRGELAEIAKPAQMSWFAFFQNKQHENIARSEQTRSHLRALREQQDAAKRTVQQVKGVHASDRNSPALANHAPSSTSTSGRASPPPQAGKRAAVIQDALRVASKECVQFWRVLVIRAPLTG